MNGPPWTTPDPLGISITAYGQGPMDGLTPRIPAPFVPIPVDTAPAPFPTLVTSRDLAQMEMRIAAMVRDEIASAVQRTTPTRVRIGYHVSVVVDLKRVWVATLATPVRPGDVATTPSKRNAYLFRTRTDAQDEALRWAASSDAKCIPIVRVFP